MKKETYTEVTWREMNALSDIERSDREIRKAESRIENAKKEIKEAKARKAKAKSEYAKAHKKALKMFTNNWDKWDKTEAEGR